MPRGDPSSTTIDVLQANVRLLAEKERLEHERQRLLELDRMRTEFLARVSHDLRTPLASIIGFSDLLLSDQHRLINRQRESLEAISRNGHALLAMINDLLDLSTLESGQMRLDPARVPVADLIADLRAATAPVLDVAGLEVEWPAAKEIAGLAAWADRRRLLQALVNLVDNARKFTPRRGRVVISAAAGDDGGVLLGVADSGPGIPESERERLFRPFAVSSGRAAGHGLGLAIVRAIVDRHRGSLAVAGGPGRGCQITLALPPYPANGSVL